MVAKDENGLRVRLQRAALELFHERGYDRTTTAEIAARAGVTERTFFRQFPTSGKCYSTARPHCGRALTAAIADAPDGLEPLDTLFRAFRSVLPLLENNRPYAKPRHELIANTPALHERELTKMAALADALAAALKREVSRISRLCSPHGPHRRLCARNSVLARSSRAQSRRASRSRLSRPEGAAD